MAYYSISVTPLKERRAHIMTCLHFIAGYLELVKASNKLGDVKALTIIDEGILNELTNRIPTIGDAGELKLEPPEICTVYVCYDMMNKLLLTPIGETLAKVALEKIIENHPLKDFFSFKYFMLKMNSQFMEDIESKMADLDGLLEKRKAMATFGLK